MPSGFDITGGGVELLFCISAHPPRHRAPAAMEAVFMKVRREIRFLWSFFRSDDLPAFFHRGRLEDLVHECGIQLRVNIIHRNAFGLRYHGWRSGTAILHFGTSAETQGAGRHGSCLHESTAGDSIFMELLPI